MDRLRKLCCRLVMRALAPGESEIALSREGIRPIRREIQRKAIELAELLGRKAVNLDTPELQRFLADKRVLVTGAGGSIGSEICRQMMRFCPERVILVERAENNLFEIDRELRERWVGADIRPCIGDVCDERRIDQIFREHQPHVVFHCAAHKHVPMMEHNPCEAIKNNIFGTKTVADAALEHESSAFVLISTDKAVNPSSVMGATKRVAELYVQSLNAGGERERGRERERGTESRRDVPTFPACAGMTAGMKATEGDRVIPLLRLAPAPAPGISGPSTAAQSRGRFVAVRFGNVLGSSGSVLPIFQKQIEAGGPVTVTHPEMKRYFMTIPEASQLVMQAGAIAKGGEVLVLDMGSQVKIVELARQLILRNGLQPDQDILIQYTGIRPGEKLFEELACDDEQTRPTAHAKIRAWQLPTVAREEVLMLLDMLADAAEQSPRAAVEALMRAVPEYKPDSLLNRGAMKLAEEDRAEAAA